MQHQQHVQRSHSQLALLILASLLQAPKHAAGLCEAIEQTQGVFFEPATLYRVLAQLEQRGWIEALTTEHPLRLYSITALGIRAMQRAEAGSQGEIPQEGGYPLLLGGKEIIMPLVIWILRLYPLMWRERYETEMAALLEQHTITIWTVLDLLIGALDGRLDPHYRRKRQLLPLRQLQTSWRWFASACVACWLGLVIWFAMWDMPIDSAGVCSDYPADTTCPPRVAIGMHTPQLSSALLTTPFYTV
jgi:DNA-binding MarR family transcriptional regulator